jgi:hypothetical protein
MVDLRSGPRRWCVRRVDYKIELELLDWVDVTTGDWWAAGFDNTIFRDRRIGNTMRIRPKRSYLAIRAAQYARRAREASTNDFNCLQNLRPLLLLSTGDWWAGPPSSASHLARVEVSSSLCDCMLRLDCALRHCSKSLLLV